MKIYLKCNTICTDIDSGFTFKIHHYLSGARHAFIPRLSFMSRAEAWPEVGCDEPDNLSVVACLNITPFGGRQSCCSEQYPGVGTPSVSCSSN